MMNTIFSQKLFSVLQEYQSKRLIVIEFNGNFGDELIYRGLRKLLKSLPLEYDIYSWEEFLSCDLPKDPRVFYLNGGFGFTSLWNNGIVDCFRKIVEHSGGPIIFGPQTILDAPDFFEKNFNQVVVQNKFKHPITFFSRELTSFKISQKCLISSVIKEHDHDTALNLQIEDLERDLSLKKVKDYYAIRYDRETVRYTKWNPFWTWFDPVDNCETFQHWVNTHDLAENLITNRLHSSIVAMILGKRVTLLANKYHKNRSVWEYSLKENGVQWNNEVSASAAERVMYHLWPYQKLCQGYNINQYQKKKYLRASWGSQRRA